MNDILISTKCQTSEKFKHVCDTVFVNQWTIFSSCESVSERRDLSN